MKLSVSLPAEGVESLDDYAKSKGIESRSDEDRVGVRASPFRPA